MLPASPPLSPTQLLPLALRHTARALFRPLNLPRYLAWSLLLWLAFLNLTQFLLPLAHFLLATFHEANPVTAAGIDPARRLAARRILEFIAANAPTLLPLTLAALLLILLTTLYLSSHAHILLLHRQIKALPQAPLENSAPAATPLNPQTEASSALSTHPSLAPLAHHLFLFRLFFCLATLSLLGLITGLALLLTYPDLDAPSLAASRLLQIAAGLDLLLLFLAALLLWILHLLIVPLMYTYRLPVRPAWRLFETRLGSLFEGQVYRLLALHVLLILLLILILIPPTLLLIYLQIPPLLNTLPLALLTLPAFTLLRYHALLFLQQNLLPTPPTLF